MFGLMHVGFPSGASCPGHPSMEETTARGTQRENKGGGRAVCPGYTHRCIEGSSGFGQVRF